MDDITRDRTYDDDPGTVAVIDREALFAHLAAKTLDDSYRLARLILGNESDAEDATHEAYEAAWRAFGQLRDAERFPAWFHRILVNTCRNRLRWRRRHQVVDISSVVETAARARDPGDIAYERAELARAFDTLSLDHRTVLALRYYGDLTVEEIADRIRVRPGTVKSRLHHALRALAAAIRVDAPEDGR